MGKSRNRELSPDYPKAALTSVEAGEVPYPLALLERDRSRIIRDVLEQTRADFEGAAVEPLLTEALYLEKQRLRREHPGFFTKGRFKRDQMLWGQIHRGLVKTAVEVDRNPLLDSVLNHYAEEICGSFDPKIYRFATNAVPWGFNWLLNAASVRHFMPWKMTQSLQSRLEIQGEVALLRKLAERGTVLLVPTHQSNIDSILIGYVIYLMGLPPFAYGAGLNLFSNPVLSFFMGRLGAYTVDRAKSAKLYKQTLKNYSVRILSEGIHSIFFPGGGRSRSGAIESKLKLGLLGTGLEAQLRNHMQGVAKPNIYVVPMVTSYHFVLEASSLIEDHLAEAGKHRFLAVEDDSWQYRKVLHFFWKLFSSRSGITVRIGRPLDVFGNFVDDEGRSVGPHGRVIDPIRWLTTDGELKAESLRDQEYTRELGDRLVSRFYHENTLLTSHLAAFAFFEFLRRKYPDLDLYRFLRLSMAQRSVPLPEFLAFTEQLYELIQERAAGGDFRLSREFHGKTVEQWLMEGAEQLGLFHEAAVLKIKEGEVWTEDLPLLYYYRNRLSGYGLSLLAEREGPWKGPGKYDEKGFLA